MALKNEIKVRERKASRFTPGSLAQILMSLGSMIMALSYSGFLGNQVKHFDIEIFREIDPLTLTGIPALIFGMAAVILGFRTKRKLQSFRNSEVALEGINALYLRTYFTDTMIPFPNPFYSKGSGGMSLDISPLGPEEFIGRVLEPFINVRQFGGSPSTIGNSRIVVSDEEWQKAVKKAIHSATVIIVLPLMNQDKSGAIHGEAMIWELQYLITSGWMDRTIVLMPHVVIDWSRRISTAWERTRVRVAEFGLELPLYDKRGGVFTLARVGEVWCPAKSFNPDTANRTRLAAGLIEAVQWMSEQYQFQLFDR